MNIITEFISNTTHNAYRTWYSPATYGTCIHTYGEQEPSFHLLLNSYIVGNFMRYTSYVTHTYIAYIRELFWRTSCESG